MATLTERGYRAATVAVKALTVSSMLSAYQAELCEDMTTKPNPGKTRKGGSTGPNYQTEKKKGHFANHI